MLTGDPAHLDKIPPIREATRGWLAESVRLDGTPEELTARARGRVFRALIGDEDLATFSRRYRITARVRTLEGIRVRAVARPGDALAGEEIEPNLEEAYLAELDREQRT